MREHGNNNNIWRFGPAVCWPPVPPWLLPEPNVDLSILDQIKKKDADDPVTLVCDHLKEKWADYMLIAQRI